MFKKKFLALGLMLILAASTLLAGCSKEETASEEARELNIIFTAGQQPQEQQYIMNEFIPAFEEEYNVTVDLQFMTCADGIKKIQSEQESGNVVTDLIFIDTANMGTLINNGYVQDITQLVADTGVTLTTMFDGATNVDGVRYFVPMSFDVYLTIANKQALPYLPDGLTEEDVQNGLTWEQFTQWAVNIAEGEGEGKTMYPSSTDSSQLLYPLGGMGIAYGAEFPNFNSPEFMAAMENIAIMAQGNAFYAEQAQYSSPADPLMAGDVWLSFAHMTPVGTAYAASPNDYVVGPAPSGPAGQGSTAGAWCWGIVEGAPNQSAAEDFIKYALTPEVNYEYCKNFGGALSPIEEVNEFITDEDVIQSAGAKMLDTAVVAGVPSTEYTDWNAVKELYTQMFNKILEDGAVPDQAYMDDLQAQLEALEIQE